MEYCHYIDRGCPMPSPPFYWIFNMLFTTGSLPKPVLSYKSHRGPMKWAINWSGPPCIGPKSLSGRKQCQIDSTFYFDIAVPKGTTCDLMEISTAKYRTDVNANWLCLKSRKPSSTSEGGGYNRNKHFYVLYRTKQNLLWIIALHSSYEIIE